MCKVTSVKAPGPGGFTDVALHAALSLVQNYSAWWPESTWLTSSCNVRSPGNDSLSGAEFCSLNERFSTRLWRAKRRQTAFPPNRTQHLRWTQTTTKKRTSPSQFAFVSSILNYISLGASTPNRRSASFKTVETLLTKAKRAGFSASSAKILECA